MSDRLTLRKGFLDDWWIIERATPDSEEGALFSDADVEGSASEMLAVAMAIKARCNFSAKRCAVKMSNHAAFRSPRNSRTDGVVSLEVADALAAEIFEKLGGQALERVTKERDDVMGVTGKYQHERDEARAALEDLSYWPCEGEHCEVTLRDVEAYDCNVHEHQPGRGIWFCGDCWDKALSGLKAERDAALAACGEMRGALEAVSVLLSELRPFMTLPNASQWARLEEAHNIAAAKAKHGGGR